jgi:4-hydroxy-3-methylbut-2-enyl diphosphate reductase
MCGAQGEKLVQRPVESKRKERRRLARQENYFRVMGEFQETKEEVNRQMVAELKSNLLDNMRAENYEVQKGEGNAMVTFRLAQEYGMCWGAERSIELALAATKKFPEKRKHITNELLHNPGVNQMLEDSGIEFIEKFDGNAKDFSNVKEGDVVILPAFGATLAEMQYLEEKGVTTVDTTCPWVSRVWNAVDKQVTKGMTTVIHGKYAHEEAIATASYCDNYIMVKDINEAEYLCNYILSPNPDFKEELMEKFKKAVSVGFDPDVHLQSIGVANQTTMYKKETTAIGKLLETTMMNKYGPEEMKERFAAFDTICDATQERQDAVREMCEDANDLDFIVVVGGYDSSNTAHLVEIPDELGLKVFHVSDPECIRPDNTISHRNPHDGTISTSVNFLAGDRPLKIGVTSGASTPDSSVQDVLERIVLLKAAVSSGEGD